MNRHVSTLRLESPRWPRSIVCKCQRHGGQGLRLCRHVAMKTAIWCAQHLCYKIVTILSLMFSGTTGWLSPMASKFLVDKQTMKYARHTCSTPRSRYVVGGLHRKLYGWIWPWLER